MAMNGNTLGDAMLAAVNALPAGDPTKPLSDPANVGSQYDKQAAMRAIAGAIVSHIQANATVTIKTTDSGLQRDNTGGNPSTLGPSTNKTLPGGCIG